MSDGAQDPPTTEPDKTKDVEPITESKSLPWHERLSKFTSNIFNTYKNASAFSQAMLPIVIIICGILGYKYEDIVSNDSSENIKVKNSAGCLILNSKGQALVLFRRDKESGQKKLDLPGGGVKDDESFMQGAKRQTDEETGGSVKVIKRLESVKGTNDYIFHLHECKFEPGAVPDILKSVREAEHINWVDLSTYNSSNWRFPKQAEEITKQYNHLRAAKLRSGE